MQVTELGSKGPKEALRLVAKISPRQCQILVAGGDGTIGWILNTAFEMNIKPMPEVCILPIGTGNDLSRVLNWGSEPPAELNPTEILQQVNQFVCFFNANNSNYTFIHRSPMPDPLSSIDGASMCIMLHVGFR